MPQQRLTDLRDADKAEVSFITGQTRSGTLAFLGSSASPETRTFLAEVVVPNEDGEIPAGISAEVRIPTGQEQAHFVSPSIVSLNAEGVIGVKTVEDDSVVFHQVEIVRAEIDGIWVTGLPERVDLITVGQGYVNDGETVRSRPQDVAQPRRRNERPDRRRLLANACSCSSSARDLRCGRLRLYRDPKEANPEVPLPLFYVSTGLDGISPGRRSGC